MDRKTVLAAAGALVLTVVGGMSALAVAFGGGAPASASESVATTDETVVITEYVDEAGNPIDGPGSITSQAQQTVIVPVQGQADEVVIVLSADGGLVDDAGASTPTTVDGDDEYDDDEYDDEDDDDEYDDDDEDEGGDDHEDEDDGDDD